MGVILPLLFFVLAFLAMPGALGRMGVPVSWRTCLMMAVVLWGVAATAVTEGLSFWFLLTPGGAVAAWAATCALILPAAIRGRKGLPPLHVSTLGRPLSRGDWFLLGGVGAVVAAVGLIALVAPPNNWDSMTYHMARVVHWIQNRTVSFYPTHIPRQLHSNPWAEYAILQFQILSGGDRFANLVQWFSFVASAAGVSRIAKQLGASSRGQIFAAAFSVTAPMGILQGSSTQNDYVAAVYLVGFVGLGIAAIRDEARWPCYAAAGASLGLAILTKGTAYLYALPFVIWFLAAKARRDWRAGIQALFVAGLATFLINFAHYTRTLGTFGSLAGPRAFEVGRYTNEVFSAPALVSNLTRHGAMHLGTPFGELNRLMEAGVQAVHRLVGADVHDPRTTYLSYRFHVFRRQNHEDFAGNLIHFLLILCTGATLFVPGIARRTEGRSLIYAGAAAAAFVFLAAMLKWNPFVTRYHLPFFILFAPVTGVVLERLLPVRWGRWGAMALVVAAIPWVGYNGIRPLVGSRNILATDRVSLYFNNRPGIESAYRNAARIIRSGNCHDIGLVMGGDSWEYPLWVLIRPAEEPRRRMEHIRIANEPGAWAARPTSQSFRPCTVISLTRLQGRSVEYQGRTYVRKWSSSPLSVFESQ